MAEATPMQLIDSRCAASAWWRGRGRIEIEAVPFGHHPHFKAALVWARVPLARPRVVDLQPFDCARAPGIEQAPCRIEPVQPRQVSGPNTRVSRSGKPIPSLFNFAMQVVNRSGGRHRGRTPGKGLRGRTIAEQHNSHHRVARGRPTEKFNPPAPSRLLQGPGMSRASIAAKGFSSGAAHQTRRLCNRCPCLPPHGVSTARIGQRSPLDPPGPIAQFGHWVKTSLPTGRFQLLDQPFPPYRLDRASNIRWAATTHGGRGIFRSAQMPALPF